MITVIILQFWRYENDINFLIARCIYGAPQQPNRNFTAKVYVENVNSAK
jgi:hypothetical protein